MLVPRKLIVVWGNPSWILSLWDLNHPSSKLKLLLRCVFPVNFSCSFICFWQGRMCFMAIYLYIRTQVLNSLTHNISSTKYNLGTSNRETVLDRLPSRTKENLLNVSNQPFYLFISLRYGTVWHLLKLLRKYEVFYQLTPSPNFP